MFPLLHVSSLQSFFGDARTHGFLLIAEVADFAGRLRVFCFTGASSDAAANDGDTNDVADDGFPVGDAVAF